MPIFVVQCSHITVLLCFHFFIFLCFLVLMFSHFMFLYFQFHFFILYIFEFCYFHNFMFLYFHIFMFRYCHIVIFSNLRVMSFWYFSFSIFRYFDIWTIDDLIVHCYDCQEIGKFNSKKSLWYVSAVVGYHCGTRLLNYKNVEGVHFYDTTCRSFLYLKDGWHNIIKLQILKIEIYENTILVEVGIVIMCYVDNLLIW